MVKAKEDPIAELAQEMDRCRRDPVHFCRRWLGIDTLWEKQVDVHHVNGEPVYPDLDFSKVLKREGDTLTGEILGARLTFRRQRDR